jgi:hypothetical protein
MSAALPPLATWHGLTGPCVTCGFVHLSFDLVNGAALHVSLMDVPGGVVRLRLSEEACRDVFFVLQQHCDAPRKTFCPVCAVRPEPSQEGV